MAAATSIRLEDLTQFLTRRCVEKPNRARGVSLVPISVEGGEGGAIMTYPVDPEGKTLAGEALEKSMANIAELVWKDACIDVSQSPRPVRYAMIAYYDVQCHDVIGRIPFIMHPPNNGEQARLIDGTEPPTDKGVAAMTMRHLDTFARSTSHAQTETFAMFQEENKRLREEIIEKMKEHKEALKEVTSVNKTLQIELATAQKKINENEGDNEQNKHLLKWLDELVGGIKLKYAPQLQGNGPLIEIGRFFKSLKEPQFNGIMALLDDQQKSQVIMLAKVLSENESALGLAEGQSNGQTLALPSGVS